MAAAVPAQEPTPAALLTMLQALRTDLTAAQATLATTGEDLRRARQRAERAEQRAIAAEERVRVMGVVQDAAELIKRHRAEEGLILKDGTKKMAWLQALVKALKNWHNESQFLAYAAESPPGRLAGNQLLSARYGHANQLLGAELAELRVLIRRIEAARAVLRQRADQEEGDDEDAEAAAAAAEEVEAGLGKLAADFMASESRRAALRELFALYVFNEPQERPVPLGPVLTVLETMDTGSFKYLPDSVIMASVPNRSVVSITMKSQRKLLPWGDRVTLSDDEAVGHTYTHAAYFDQLLQRHLPRPATLTGEDVARETTNRAANAAVRRPQERGKKDGKPGKECLKCLYLGHIAANCPNQPHSQYNDEKPYELLNRFREGKVKPE